MSDFLAELLVREKKNRMHLPEISDSKDMINVDMNTYAVTKGNSVNPVLKTIGASSCVALALYDESSKTAGLAHIIPTSSKNAVSRDINNLIDAMRRNGVSANTNNNTLISYAFGGFERRYFPQLVRDVLAENGIIQITSEESTENVPDYSIGINAQTGEIFKLSKIIKREVSDSEKYVALNQTEKGIEVTSDKRSLS